GNVISTIGSANGSPLGYPRIFRAKSGSSTVLVFNAASTSMNIFYSEDGGATWIDTGTPSLAASEDLLLWPGYYEQYNSNIIHQGSSIAVSSDGKTWTTKSIVAAYYLSFTKFGLTAATTDGLYKVENGAFTVITTTDRLTVK